MKKRIFYSVIVFILLFTLAPIHSQERFRQIRLPVANEENLQTHFESIVNNKDPELFENTVRELRNDLGLYMTKHFTLPDTLKEYFSNERLIKRSESKTLAFKPGEEIPSYYSKIQKEAWNEFWDESIRLYRERSENTRAMTQPVMFTPKLPPSSGADSEEGKGCLGIGLFVEENDSGGYNITLCICLIIINWCFTF